MVKENALTPLPKRTLGGKKFTNSELPSGAQDNGVWRQVFIPTYVQYLASRTSNDAWTISDDDAIQLMQQIWKFIYGARITYRIKTKGPVFFLVSTLSHINVSSPQLVACSRQINVSVNGTADSVLPHLPSLMHSLNRMPMTSIRMIATRTLRSPCFTNSLFFLAALRRQKRR
jgi:hypothetical protein